MSDWETRALAAEATIVQLREALSAFWAMADAYDHSSDDCQGTCVIERGRVFADFVGAVEAVMPRAALAAGVPSTPPDQQNEDRESDTSSAVGDGPHAWRATIDFCFVADNMADADEKFEFITRALDEGMGYFLQGGECGRMDDKDVVEGSPLDEDLTDARLDSPTEDWLLSDAPTSGAEELGDAGDARVTAEEASHE